MSNPLISVIVPVYKAERYLPRCINSILNQSYKNFELILVDDGSPDNSGKICDDYALKDNRIKVIHKENGGVSSARNAGIDVATGEYINFIDSDDWITLDSLEKLLATIKNNDAQISIGNWDRRRRVVQETAFKNLLIDFNNKVEDFQEDVFTLLNFSINAPWGKLYLTSIIKDNSIYFKNDIKYGEDTIFLFTYLKFCEKIATSTDIVYHYNLFNENSASIKYYEEEPDWINLVIDSKISFMKLKGVNQLKIEEFSAKNAVILLNFLFAKYVKVFDRQTAIDKISKMLSRFNDYIFANTNWVKCARYEPKLNLAIYNRDASGIYSEIYRKNKVSLIKRVKHLAFKIVAPYIERKRDGLIKYKAK